MSKELEAFKEIKLRLSNVSVDTKGELVYKLNPSNYLLCQIVEQALLKAEETKQYLEWKDLDFTDGVWKATEVVLNGVKYTLHCYKNCIDYTYVKIYLNGMVVADLCNAYKADIQFFNDLHLEVVE